MTDILLYGYFEDSTNKDGETGLTVTVDIWRITKSSAATSEVATGGSAVELGDGVYLYRLASGDLSLYDYVAIFKTASTAVSSKHVPGIRWDGAEQWATQLARLTGDLTTAIAAIIAYVDASINSRLATAGYTAPPTVAAIADGISDELLSGHTTPGSAAMAWSTAGSAADPLGNAVPGSYTPGEAGYVLGHLGDGRVSLTYPVIGEGGTIHTYRGADYYAADGRSIDWTDTDSTLPSDITGAAVAVTVKDSDGEIVTTFTGSVVTPTGTKQIRLELASTASDDVPEGAYTYRVKVTLAAGMGSHVIPWREGIWISEDL